MCKFCYCGVRILIASTIQDIKIEQKYAEEGRFTDSNEFLIFANMSKFTYVFSFADFTEFAKPQYTYLQTLKIMPIQPENSFKKLQFHVSNTY